jgi:hypothetical protein
MTLVVVLTAPEAEAEADRAPLRRRRLDRGPWGV